MEQPALEIAKLVVSVLIPATLAFFGFKANKYLQDVKLRDERRREDEKTRRDAEEKARLTAKEKEEKQLYKIEFDMNCRFFGPHFGKYAAEFVLFAHNKSTHRHQLNGVKLRVRGIRQNVPFSFWSAKYEHRLEFLEAILSDDVIPKKWNFIFVDPGVRQSITYQTIIDTDFKYITARAEFYYDKNTPHSTEKMFEVGLNGTSGDRNWHPEEKQSNASASREEGMKP